MCMITPSSDEMNQEIHWWITSLIDSSYHDGVITYVIDQMSTRFHWLWWLLSPWCNSSMNFCVRDYVLVTVSVSTRFHWLSIHITHVSESSNSQHLQEEYHNIVLRNPPKNWNWGITSLIDSSVSVSRRIYHVRDSFSRNPPKRLKLRNEWVMHDSVGPRMEKSHCGQTRV